MCGNIFADVEYGSKYLGPHILNLLGFVEFFNVLIIFLHDFILGKHKNIYEFLNHFMQVIQNVYSRPCVLN